MKLQDIKVHNQRLYQHGITSEFLNLNPNQA